MASRVDNLARMARAATPTALGLFGVLLLALPLRLAEGFAPTPILPLVVIYFWSIYGPSYLPPASVFSIGLLQDFLTGGPLGLWPAAYLALQYVAVSQRAYFYGREQRVVWLGFGVAAAGVSLMMWLVMSLMSGVLLPIWRLAAQMAATAAVYPILAIAFANLHRRVIVET
ncbi:MAG: hypothetical protein R3C40_09625 [Parvularculaceae bacterium]